jgi:16S rRNA (guanine(527)-N(7))-methyltransferase RsmG
MPTDLVPRETPPALAAFVDLLATWNRRVNLVSRREAENIWSRHVFDTAQLAAMAPRSAASWLDLGSGAGFPGLVCAAIVRGEGRPIRFTLVESDGRKAAFLREAALHMGVDVAVLHQRIERVSLPPQDVISARALAPLDSLLEYAFPFCGPNTVLLFPKGARADSELTLARRHWHSRVVRFPSRTDPAATILRLSEVSRRR